MIWLCINLDLNTPKCGTSTRCNLWMLVVTFYHYIAYLVNQCTEFNDIAGVLLGHPYLYINEKI